MSNLVSKLADNMPWIKNVSAVNYIIFMILFIVIVIGVLRMRKSNVEEYKNIPLDEDNHANNHQNQTEK